MLCLLSEACVLRLPDQVEFSICVDDVTFDRVPEASAAADTTQAGALGDTFSIHVSSYWPDMVEVTPTRVDPSRHWRLELVQTPARGRWILPAWWTAAEAP